MPEHLIKLKRPGKIPTYPVAVKHREDNRPHIQVPRITTITSSRIIIFIASRIDNPYTPLCMIHGAGYPFDRNQTSGLGENMFNKRVKFNNKAEVDGKDLNTMVKKVRMDYLKGGKNKSTQVVATEIDESRNKDKYFGIGRINLAVLERNSEPYTGWRTTTTNFLHLIT